MACFLGVQLSDGGEIAIVPENWLTPRKEETFWPVFSINKIFFESGKTTSINKACLPKYINVLQTIMEKFKKNKKG